MMGGILLYAFAAALLGGIDSPGGAVLGGFPSASGKCSARSSSQRAEARRGLVLIVACCW